MYNHSTGEKHCTRRSRTLGNAHNWSLEEIAETMGISRERVRQLASAALDKMRTSPVIREAWGVEDTPAQTLHFCGMWERIIERRIAHGIE
jgi:hypothetical protein